MLKYSQGSYLNCIDMPSDLIDETWTPAVNGPVYGIAVQPGVVYIGGAFSSAGGQNRNNIAALDATTAQASPTWNPNANNAVWSLAIAAGDLITVGNFTDIGGQPRSYAAALNISDGTAVPSWDPSPSEPLQLAVTSPLGQLLLGGGYAGTMYDFQQRTNTFAVDLTDFQVTSWNPAPDGTVRCIQVTDNAVYLGGQFTFLGGQPRNAIAAVNKTNGNATTWNPSANNQVVALKLANSSVYAAGDFTTIGGASRQGIARLNLTTGAVVPAFNANSNGGVWDLEASNDKLFLAGSFNLLGGSDRIGVGVVNLTTGSLLDDVFEVNGPVYDLALAQNTVYLGGAFNEVQGEQRASLCALDRESLQPTAWNPGTNGQVTGVRLKSSYVFVYGNFTAAGGQTVGNMAMLSANTGFNTTWYPTVSGTVQDLETTDSSAYVAGQITALDGTSILNIGRYSFPMDLFATKLELVREDRGGNLGRKSFSVYGSGFTDGTQVRLERAGFPDIVATDSTTMIIDAREILASADLTEAAEGPWNLVVEVPGDTTMILADGFTIEAAALPQLSISIIGPPVIRPGLWNSYTISVANTGNIDALAVPLSLAFPQDVEYDIDGLFVRDDSIPEAVWDTLAFHIDVDTLFGEPMLRRVVPFLLSSVPGGGTSEFVIKLRSPGTATFGLRAWLAEDYLGVDSTVFGRSLSCENPTTLSCFAGAVSGAMNIVGAFVPPGFTGCIYSVVNAVIQKSMAMVNCRQNPAFRVATPILVNYNMAKECAAGISPITRWAVALRTMRAMSGGYSA
ncbi:MAG: hypothetical protein IPN62_11970 [Flavobacteriales bacterium]|nr:hypothetical protein [Flavobacteriales bacterium]